VASDAVAAKGCRLDESNALHPESALVGISLDVPGLGFASNETSTQGCSLHAFHLETQDVFSTDTPMFRQYQVEQRS
jgi:hypothetical protein